MSVLRRAAKTVLERALLASGAPARRRQARTDDVVVLAYHNVVPRGEPRAGDGSLHLAQADFGRQLDRLLDTHDVIALEDVLTRGSDNARPAAVITFDDGYLGTLTAGVEELAIRDLPATVFVVPGMLDRRTFWWDRYADAMGRLDTAFRRRALRECRGLDQEVERWAASVGHEPTELPEHASTATLGEIETAMSRAPITLGNHTWSHANLAALDDVEIAEELGRTARWLAERKGAVRWASYPYGQHSLAARTIAAEHGDGGLLIEGGLTNPRDADVFAVPRLNVPAGMTLGGLELRASGVLGDG